MKKETYHVISNTHWDREWYLDHEKFLVRLVELMDRLIEIMESKKDYIFVTDGQFALVGDYIEAKPENKDRVKKLVKEGRLLVGPWYTQPLENIVGGEALIRNLQKGFEESNKLGGVMKFSYEIDEFGHTSQLPQILDGFGIHDVMAWRGVPNHCRSYFKWYSPDGTEAHFFNSNAGYGEATAIPDSTDDYTETIDGISFAREGIKSMVKSMRELRLKVSDSEHMMWLNGIDHSWAQEDILEVIDKINLLYPDYKVIQDTPMGYAEAVKEDLKEKNIKPEKAYGELMFTNEPVLESTNALHPRQKRRHYESEKLLVREVEPLTAVSYALGDKYPQWAIDRSWKYILENHAHDSLGCCSVDEVFEQVMSRYGASLSLSEQVKENSLRYIMSCSTDKPSVWIFNLSEKSVKGSVRANFDLPVGFGDDNIDLYSPDGNKVNMSIISVNRLGDVRYNPRLGHPTWGEIYRFDSIIDSPEIPPYSAIRLDIVNKAFVKVINGRQERYFATNECGLENQYLKIDFNSNGTFNLTDKRTNNEYKNQMLFTDDGESGHVYVHSEPINDRSRISSQCCDAEIRTLFDTPLGAAAEVKITLNIPVGITVDRRERLNETKPVTITSKIYLGKDSEYLKIDISIDNKCRNHRIRALFPSYAFDAKNSESGQAFDEVVRPIYIPDDDTLAEKPYLTHPMQDYCAVYSKNKGIGLSARGIYEYECIDDKERTLALTLLRAIELIDNDTFQYTPEYFMHEAQNLCTVDFSINLIPYTGCREELLKTVKSSLMLPIIKANRQTEDSLMPGYIKPDNIIDDSFSFITLEGEGIEITTLYKTKSRNTITVRLRNRLDKESECNLKLNFINKDNAKIYETTLEQNSLTEIGTGKSVKCIIPAKKLKTFEFEI